ncbi:JAB domain-containing protein [Sphingomonas sp. Mn802worker]|uniref:JAB domain-containing protein n=1 Tax=Sphingomonas sp. Mn802worker TaxID=629773 RepID=UPI00037B0C45|nr:DNA repair protein RadC [Sphingomonas sp. Mn802worker]
MAATLTASPHRIDAVVRDGAAVSAALASFAETMSGVLECRLDDRPLVSDSIALHDLLRVQMAFLPREEVRALFLDTRNRLIRSEVVARGTIDATAIHVRELIHRALDLGSTAIILAHNHPSGDPTPSRHDVALTRAVLAAAAPLKIALHDHVIVAAGGQVSLRAAGLI